MEGLVIDDYFSIASTPKDSAKPPKDVEAFKKAQDIYKQFDIIGSPSKDVIGASESKVIGASINASDRAMQSGICPLGAPSAKRFALSWITLQLTCLSHTSDVLHLCLVGGWVSCLGFRRPLMALLNETFALVDASKVDPLKPKVIALPRAVACEMLLLALLCPLAISDLCAPHSSQVYATDASSARGAICSAPINVDFARILWRTSRSKGAYHRLLTPSQALAKNLGVFEELPESQLCHPDRPLAFHYDFIEVFSGASVVTKAVAALGYVVGPPVDLSICPEYDMSYPHVLAWLSFMVSSGALLSLIVEPPCTTFSIMRRPALRSRLCPFGFRPRESQTFNGNLLALRALALMHLSYINLVTCLLEKPYSSLLKHMPSYKALLCKEHVSQCRTDSCMLGSIHKKSFRFVGVHADLEPLSVLCDRSHEHVQIAGQYTKKSATYTPALATLIAQVLAAGIDRKRASLQCLESLNVGGLENQLVNAVALSADWKVDDAWDFKKNSHINILEFSVLEKLAKKLVSQGPLRVTCMVDSHVVSAASAKGRSSSLGLRAVVRRFCALSLAGGLYFSVPFVPTRLNVPDDPTRNVPLRLPSGSYNVFDWSADQLYDFAALPKLRRWSSNWVRLVISVCGPRVLSLTDRSVYRHAFPHCGCLPLRTSFVPPMDFDATLGFPGEGPVCPCPWFVVLWKLTQRALCCTLGRSFSFWFLLSSFAMVHVSAMEPRNSADLSRQARRNIVPLTVGRPVLPSTTFNRDNLFEAFCLWCRHQQIDIEFLLSSALQHSEDINTVLSHYGRQLYYAGRPYGHFAGTINAVVSRRAILRRHLQPAWDVAYSWMRNEPPTHHTACPWQVALALIATALLWGWTREAGIIALCFAGILRAGEGLKALRRDLLLPSDSLYMNDFILLAIDEAKTRFSTARHQCAKVDAADMVRVIQIGFSKLLPNEHLWPFSGQTFRNRFKSLQTSLGLPTAIHNGLKPLDVGSLRPGGATWLLQCTENAELVRRRGRWTTTKVLEVYLQETACVRFWTNLTDAQRSSVSVLATSFPYILEKSEQMAKAAIPEISWYKIFCWS